MAGTNLVGVAGELRPLFGAQAAKEIEGVFSLTAHVANRGLTTTRVGSFAGELHGSWIKELITGEPKGAVAGSMGQVAENSRRVPIRAYISEIGGYGLPEGTATAEDAARFMSGEIRTGKATGTFAIVQGEDGVVQIGRPHFWNAWPGLDQQGIITVSEAEHSVTNAAGRKVPARSVTTSGGGFYREVAPDIDRLDLTGRATEVMWRPKAAGFTGAGSTPIIEGAPLPTSTPDLSVRWERHDDVVKGLIGPEGYLPLGQ